MAKCEIIFNDNTRRLLSDNDKKVDITEEMDLLENSPHLKPREEEDAIVGKLLDQFSHVDLFQKVKTITGKKFQAVKVYREVITQFIENAGLGARLAEVRTLKHFNEITVGDETLGDIFSDMQKQGKVALDKRGLDMKEIYRAMAGETDDISKNNLIIGQALRKFQQKNANEYATVYKSFGYRNDHAGISAMLDKNSIELLGTRQSANILIDKLSDEFFPKNIRTNKKAQLDYLEAFLESSYLSRGRASKDVLRDATFKSRQLIFKDADAEYKVLTELGLAQDGDVLTAFIQHQKRLGEQEAKILHLGEFYESNLEAFEKNIFRSGIDQGVDKKTLQRSIEDITSLRKRVFSPIGIADANFAKTISSLSKLTSAIYTPYVVIRNIYDNIFQAANISRTTTGQSSLINIFKGIFDLRRTLTPGGRLVVDEWMTNMGLTGFLSNQSKGVSIFGEDLINATDFRTKDSWFDRMSNASVQGVAKYSGSDVTFRAQTFTASLRHANHFQALLNMGWKNIDGPSRIRLKELGVSEESFDILSKIEREKVKIGTNDHKLFITPQAIDKAIDKAAGNPELIKKLKTAKQAYTSFINLNTKMELPQVYGATLFDFKPESYGSMGHLVLGTMTKFFNIANQAWYNQLRAVYIANNKGSMFGEWNDLASKEGSIVMARYLATLATGGIAVSWINDIVRNKTPRTIHGEQGAINIAQGALGLGIGGATGAVIGAMAMYGAGVTDAPLPNLAEKLWKAITAKKASSRNRQLAELALKLPGINLPVVQQLIREMVVEDLLGVNTQTRFSRKRDRKNKQKKLIER